MNSKTIIALITLAIPCLAFGQGDGKYRCTYGDLVRRVEILTEPGVTVPCEVHYYKDTEAPGETQVLWSAGSQAGYCEQKTAEFIAKLEGWGWDCSGAAAEPGMEAEMEAEMEADTEADMESEMEPEVETEMESEVESEMDAGETPAEEPVRDDTDVLSPGNPGG